ncbi:MAG: energy transducer TonB [Ginsengibacter sp.]
MEIHNMDTASILNADLLDILFDGKNKAYGAYDLRKSYNNRISVSLVITIAVIGIVFTTYAIARHYSSKNVKPMDGPDVVLHKLFVEPPPPPPLLPLPAPHVATIVVFTPLIVKDKFVPAPPADVDKIMVSKIDVITSDGIKDIGVINPPLNMPGTQVVAKTGERKKEDLSFIPVEIEASFPGGDAEWSKYVGEAVRASIDEFTEADYGTCTIKFIVDTTGKVSQVEATTMKGTKLAEIAIHAIRKGPAWIPAQQNGARVIAYRYQPVTVAIQGR